MTSGASVHLIYVCAGARHNGITVCPSRIKERRTAKTFFINEKPFVKKKDMQYNFCKKPCSRDAVVAE